jgi:predicted  nucleic acid-binding Zn-ribbon protein
MNPAFQKVNEVNRLSDIEVFIRKNTCTVCGKSVFYSVPSEQIFCGCGKRKQRYTQDFEEALKELWRPSQIRSDALTE